MSHDAHEPFHKSQPSATTNPPPLSPPTTAVPPDDNSTLFQSFEWYTPSTPPSLTSAHNPTSSHYTRLARLLPTLVSIGITALWLPPGCKAKNAQGNGYDIYDLWDLGEFEQPSGQRSVKWGSREELADLMTEAKRLGVGVIWDAVLNHKTGGDGKEECWAVEVNKDDRRIEVTEPKKIEAYLRFDFPGRRKAGMPCSDFVWRAEHFNGTDWDARARRNAIYKLIDDPNTSGRQYLEQLRTWRSHAFSTRSPRPPKAPETRSTPPRRPGKGWAEDVDDENGNADYLMFSNIDYTHPTVQDDTLRWGKWMVENVGVNGFRLDAVQHYSYDFTRDWIHYMNTTSQNHRNDRNAFIVGEIWTGDVRRIIKWLDHVGHGAYAYDSPLLYNFSRISEDVRTHSPNSDLRTILRDSLLACRPQAAVTLVTNHDTQPGQTMYTPMWEPLKPLWYAFVLLRREGYPCVFWGDLYGTRGAHGGVKPEAPACVISDGKGGKRSLLADLMLIRKLFAYGKQTDYFNSRACIAWTRAGCPEKAGSGCVVLLAIDPWPQSRTERRGSWPEIRRESSPKMVTKKLAFGRSGEVFVDIMLNADERAEVTIDAKGVGAFNCKVGNTVGVFVRKDVASIGGFPVRFDMNPYRE